MLLVKAVVLRILSTIIIALDYGNITPQIHGTPYSVSQLTVGGTYSRQKCLYLLSGRCRTPD